MGAAPQWTSCTRRLCFELGALENEVDTLVAELADTLHITVEQADAEKLRPRLT